MISCIYYVCGGLRYYLIDDLHTKYTEISFGHCAYDRITEPPIGCFMAHTETP